MEKWFEVVNNQCFLALILSWFVLLAFIGYKVIRNYWYVRARLERGDYSVLSKRMGMPMFMAITIGVFVSLVVIFFPVCFYDGAVSDGLTIVKIFKALLYAVHCAMRTFVIDMDFAEIYNAFSQEDSVFSELSGFVYRAYLTHAAVMFVAAPALTAVGILSFFKDLFAGLRFSLSPKRRMYYFSELNPKSLALAINVLAEKRSLRHPLKPIVVFYDVQDVDEVEGVDIVHQAKRLGAICFRKDICDANLRDGLLSFFLPTERKFYFISEDEDKSVRQALELIRVCRSKDRVNNGKTQFYVFATTEESGLLLEAADHGDMKERRINEKRNLVLNILTNEPVFDHYEERVVKSTDKKADGVRYEKHVNVLVVGGGRYGTELVKALCWCSQIPGYYIHIHVFDKDDNADKRLRAIAPALMDNSGCTAPGLPHYEIKVYNGINVKDSSFIEKIGEIDNINLAFITLGDDSTNVNTAIILRREILRRLESRLFKAKDTFSSIHRPSAKKKYRVVKSTDYVSTIYSVVYNAVKSETLINNKGMHDDRCEIKFIGDLQTCYSVPVIEQTSLEDEALKVDNKWTKIDDKQFIVEKSIILHNYRKTLKEKHNIEDKIDILEREKKILLRIQQRSRLSKIKILYRIADFFVYSRITKRILKIEKDLETNKAELLAKNKEIEGVYFNRPEYNRSSSIASVVYRTVLNNLGQTEDDAYEHIRWTAYMQSEGFVTATKHKGKDLVAKTHLEIRSKKEADELKARIGEREQKRKIKKVSLKKRELTDEAEVETVSVEKSENKSKRSKSNSQTKKKRK